MTNIWEFFEQTLTVSIVAAVLLVIKYLLIDKLSPRWQYGIWSILVLRILLPVQNDRMVFLPVSYWIEILKAKAESGLHSAYASVFEPVVVKYSIPSIINRPASVTDWLFVNNVLGIIICLLRYLVTYANLRWKLRNGQEVQIQAVCEKYQLKSCKAIKVEGLQTPFVCAGIKPILVLPAEKEIEENVILHELLHLKYHDEWQTCFWCILKCLHWCNPFWWYVFVLLK